MTINLKQMDDTCKNKKFIKTDMGTYVNTKYITKVKYHSDECFYLSSLFDYSAVGVVCKNNNPENYRMLKEHIGSNDI